MIEPRDQPSPALRRRGLCAALTFTLVMAPTAARAMDPIEGLRSLGLGSSLRGFAYGAEGLLLNPSGFAMVRQYAITALYTLRVQSLGHGIHVSVADSVTQQRIAMGLYYNFIHESPQTGFVVSETGKPDGRLIRVEGGQLVRQGHEAGVVTAFPLGDRFSLGVTTKYTYYSLTAPLASNQVPADFAPTNPAIDKDRTYDMGSIGNALSFDVGVTARLWSGLYLGVVGQNLWPHGAEVPSMFATGLAYLPSNRLLLAADVSLNFTGFRECLDPKPPPSLLFCQDLGNRTVIKAGGGVEYLLSSRIPLRAGYLFDSNLGAHHVTGGIGYFDPRFGLDFGFRQRVSGGMETTLVMGFRLLRD